MKKIEFIVPLLNEQENIRLFYQSLLTELEGLSCLQYQITYIDDGSTDLSWQQIEQLSDQDSRVRGVRFSRNFGKEFAIEAGLRQSDADAVIVIDSDLQHPVAMVPEFIQAWQHEGYKVVSGVKARRQKESKLKSVLANSYYFLFNRLSGLALDQMTDFKLLDRQVVQAWLALPERERFFRGLVAWLGYREKTLEFVPLERVSGETSWSLRQLFSYARSSLVSFSYAPLKLISILSLVMLVFAVLLGVQSLFYKIMGYAEEGFTTVILTQLIIGCSIMFALSSIGSYIARIYDELKARPHYVISEQTTPEQQDARVTIFPREMKRESQSPSADLKQTH
ncbi:glycosyltransferase family 2 protein [Oceanospirillum sediminis]|uniref:Glycosyltransferase family 2 protein n=1 Tax=Oceanospirillum sediminis TaxID=2760088 RepID=A0A839IQ64_9GAMM|nr:glycosyltransferase family 2 protein [Oceanospirillum sediminis]MBB1486629.1 glycosyltransferase family 2 protein [Oceanospirillum sediminis]